LNNTIGAQSDRSVPRRRYAFRNSALPRHNHLPLRYKPPIHHQPVLVHSRGKLLHLQPYLTRLPSQR